MTRTGIRRAILTARGGCVFELLARFNVGNQGYANAQVLGPPEGVNVGQLTVVEVDGTLAVVGNECVFTAQGTPLFGDLGAYSQAIVRTLGKALFGIFNFDQTNQVFYGPSWSDNGGLAGVDQLYTVVWLATAVFNARSYNGAGGLLDNAQVGAYALGTDYTLCWVLGGYDANGVPWDDTQPAANFLYGAALYIIGGAYTDWTLLWRTTDMNTATLYATFQNTTQSGTGDDFRVPEVDYSPVLQPTVKDTFTDINGTLLPAHTLDISLAAWVSNAGVWDIQTNRADPSNVPAQTDVATTTGLADGFVRVQAHTGQAAVSVKVGLVYRFSDILNYWFAWLDTTNTWAIYEVNGGVINLRAGGAGPAVAPNTTYEITVVLDGQNMQAWFNGGNHLAFASVFNQAATGVGMRSQVNGALTNGNWFDNFHLQPRDGYVQLDLCA